MAKKKDLTEENVQVTENDVDNLCELHPPQKIFPKIASKAKIKSITREKDLVKVKFKDLTFSTGQENQLAQWMDEEDEILVTLEQYQAKIK